jgi:hypothetical protein
MQGLWGDRKIKHNGSATNPTLRVAGKLLCAEVNPVGMQ